MKQIIEKIKAAYKVLIHREYIVLTSTADYNKRTIKKLSCYIGDNNTKLFNESAIEFLNKLNKK